MPTYVPLSELHDGDIVAVPLAEDYCPLDHSVAYSAPFRFAGIGGPAGLIDQGRMQPPAATVMVHGDLGELRVIEDAGYCLRYGADDLLDLYRKVTADPFRPARAA